LVSLNYAEIDSQVVESKQNKTWSILFTIKWSNNEFLFQQSTITDALTDLHLLVQKLSFNVESVHKYVHYSKT